MLTEKTEGASEGAGLRCASLLKRNHFASTLQGFY